MPSLYTQHFPWFGPEPNLDTTKQPTNSVYYTTMNWYHYMCDERDARQYLNDYLEKRNRFSEIEKLDKVPNKLIPAPAAWIARLIDRGVPLAEHSKAFLEETIKKSITKKIRLDDEQIVIVKPTLAEKTQERLNELLSEIEKIIDTDDKFSLYDYLTERKVPSFYSVKIINFYKMWMLELVEAYSSKDEQLKQAYRRYTKPQLKNKIAFFGKLLEDAHRYGNNKVVEPKKPRKPRTKKIKTPEMKFKHFEYQKESKEYSLTSIDHVKILGAKELWTFNTKYKLITVFYAANEKGFDIHRTAITNYDEKKSMTKRSARQTKELVARVLNDGKIARGKIMNEMKHDAPMGARIGENTILLKVIS